MFFPVPPTPSGDTAPAPQPGAAAASPDEVRDLRAVVGSNADYFLRAWGRVLAGGHGPVGFNRAAFFLGGFWLAYRRMYRAAFTYYGVMLGILLLEDVLFRGALGLSRTPLLWVMAVGFTAAVVCGGCANRWYLGHARRVVAEVRARSLPPAETAEVLTGRGGTDLAGALGVVAVCGLAAFALRGVLGG